MPTNRRRRVRVQKGLSPEEIQWLTGVEQEAATKLWRFRIEPNRVTRCREIMQTYAHLIPRGRRPELEADLRLWAPPAPRGLASFR
jgi:hypothetical protein